MNYPQRNQDAFKWSFWLHWVTATTLGMFASVFIFTTMKLNPAPIPFSFVTLSGFLIGLTQWQVLRKVLPKTFWWLVANFFGSLLGIYSWFFSLLFLTFIPLDYQVFISLLIYSFVIGYLQFLALKRYIIQPILWIPYNTGAFIFSFIISLAFRSLGRYIGFYPTMGDWIILILSHSFMQATILTWLLRNKRIQG